MFDDFNYKTLADAQKNGWVARTEKGHPGIKNATWWDDSISFHPDSLYDCSINCQYYKVG
jgi:hypothetical protein